MSDLIYRCGKLLCAGIVTTLLCGFNALAQLPSFPGAEGAGALTTGGRGTTAVPTTVFEVTSLADDGSVGTLRYALTHTATYRTVVFRVSGTIHLLSPLKITKANTTIAGQTAPGDGICLADYPVTINADNVIVRYMRFRMGDKNQNTGMVDGAGADDAFGGTGRKNIIVDHCTMSWSTDESCSIYGGDSTTIQWCIMSEPLNYSYHFETGDVDFEHHGYGGIWGGRHASMHHNLLAHCQGRVPRFDGSRNLTPYTAGQENVDFVNNVIYNWGSYNTNGGEGGNYNIQNNYYKYGPNTSTSTSSGVQVKYEIINPYFNSTLPYGKYYLTGNYVDGSVTNTNNNWRGAAMASGSYADTASAKVLVPFTVNPAIAMQSATDAYDSVLLKAGASLPVRDTLDQRIIANVINRTGSIIDVQGGYPHGTAYALTVNAWPALASATAPVDSDHDGMPDYWELANGSNPTNAADRNDIAFNGYTKLENYLNNISNSTNHLPVFTQGNVQSATICAGVTLPINTQLAVIDSDTAQPLDWSISVLPVHGTLLATYSSTSTGAVITPSGLTYTPAVGFSGVDSFSVVIYDGEGRDTTKVFVTVNPLPLAGSIAGVGAVCLANTITLTSSVSGGVWSSFNSSATVSATGAVNGVLAGVDTIYYTVTNGCGSATAAHSVAIETFPVVAAIGGPSLVCVGSVITLSSTTSGGVWSSSNGLASVAGGVTTGISTGVDTINYSFANSCGTAVESAVITVDPDLTGGTGAGVITGPSAVCVGAAITLANTVSGGTWSSGSATATVVGGVVTGVGAGTATISYHVSSACGTAITSQLININPLPSVTSISGAHTVCSAATITLYNSTAGGIWSAANGAASVSGSGIVAGVAPGIDTINYTVANTCGSAVAGYVVTVTDLAAIPAVLTGLSNVCLGSSVSLSASIAGGVWSASNTHASVIAGIVSGISAGADTVYYTITNSCNSVSTSKVISVDVLPFAGIITGVDTMCQGSIITLYATGTGGVWSNNDPAILIASGGGVVGGISPGTDVVHYTVTNACGTDIANKSITVMSLGYCNPTLNVDDHLVASSLWVAPNPTSGSFVVNVSSPTKEAVSVVVTNIVGQVVKELVGETNTATNIVLDQPSGVYFISVSTNTNKYTTKLIINR